MTERVRIEAGGDGAPRVLKAARPGERSHLRHEHDVLRAARHPGVVEVVAWHDDDTRPELELGFVGSHSLETAPQLALPALARVAAALYATLADLHALGIVHGGLDETHVLLDADDRPVLCSFGQAEHEPSGGADEHEADGDDPAHDHPTPEGDVAAAGNLLTRLLAAETETDPIPLHRLPWARPRSTNTWHRRLLLAIADQATHPEPHRRPPARQLATAFGEAVDPRAARRLGRWAPAALAGAGVLVVLLLASWLQPGAGADPEVTRALEAAADHEPVGRTGPQPDRDPQDGSSTVPATASSTVSSTVHPVAPELPPPTSAVPAVAPGPSDDPGPSEGAGAAPVLEHDGRRFAVGRPGDVAVVGDWDCDGEGTPALVRPATGEVFVFDTWALDAAVAVPALDTVAGATGPRREAQGACDRLVVERSAGDPVEIQVGDRS